MISELKHRRVTVHIYESETALEGYFLGIEEGFVMLAARLDIQSEISLIDRESVFCINTLPETQPPAAKQ
jgi:hypothetical protein